VPISKFEDIQVEVQKAYAALLESLIAKRFYYGNSSFPERKSKMVEIENIKLVLRQLIPPKDVMLGSPDRIARLRTGVAKMDESTTFRDLGIEDVQEVLPQFECAFAVSLKGFSPETVGELLTTLNELS